MSKFSKVCEHIPSISERGHSPDVAAYFNDLRSLMWSLIQERSSNDMKSIDNVRVCNLGSLLKLWPSLISVRAKNERFLMFSRLSSKEEGNSLWPTKCTSVTVGRLRRLSSAARKTPDQYHSRCA